MSSKNKRRRLLTMESLSKRELLASDLGAVSGVAFSDVNTNNIVDAGDTLLNNVQIQIFADTNTNNVFDPGIDLAAAPATTTNASGEYRFDNLSPGTHFVQQAAVAGVNNPGVATVEVVDDDGVQVQQIDNYIGTISSVSAGPPNSATETGSFAGVTEAIGGNRDVVVSVDTTNAENGSIQALFNGTGELLLNAGGDAGTVLIQYDGADGVTTLDSENGLNGVSLAGGAANETPAPNSGLILRLRSENVGGDSAQLRIFSGAGQTSTFNVPIPANATIQEVFVPFDDFTGNADFNSVNAIEAEVGLSLDNDVRVQIIETITPAVVVQNLVNTPPQIDLTIRKDVNAAASTLQRGGTVVFDIEVENLSQTDDATLVQVQDILPAGLTFNAGASNLGGFVATPNGQTINIAIGDLAAGATETFQLAATIDADVITDLTNVASVSGAETETNPDNNDDNALVDLQFADLTITKVDQTDPVNAGNQEVYTITVTNLGPDTATDVRITDNLPDDVTFDTGTGGTFTENPAGSGDLTIAVGDIPSGQQRQVTVTVTVADDAISPLNNVASVIANPDNDINLDNNDTSEQTVVNRAVDVAITKTVSDATPIAGEDVVYTVQVVNNGPGVARGVSVSDILQPELTFVSFDAGTSDATFNGAVGQNLTFDLNTLNVGETQTFMFTATVATSATGTIPNEAIVSTTDNDTVAANDQSTANIVVGNEVDLILTKNVDLATAIPGQSQLLYTFTIAHDTDSLSDASTVVVTDTLPAGVTFAQVNAGQADRTNNNGQTVTVEFDSIPNGETRTFSILVDVLEDATGDANGNLVNPATLTAANDSDASNNTDDATTALTPQFDVTITKVVDDETPQQGDTVTYTVGLLNSGPSTATNVVLSDDVPAGLTFVSGTLNGNAASLIAGDVVFPAITLADDATATATLVFTVGAAASGAITNTASVTASNGETNLNNNSAQEVITVTPQTDITVAKSVDQATAQVGDTLQYTVTVTNSGPNAAVNVVATDTLPAGVSFVSGNGPSGALTAVNGVVTVNGGTLASGANFQFTINATINAGVTTDQTNVVAVATDTAETNLNNNTAQAVTTVDPVLSSIAGTVYIDANNNGSQDTGEVGIAGVALTLSGTDSQGTAVNQSATTDANGDYIFANLAAGTYQVNEVQPAGFRDGQESVGTVSATAGDDVFTAIGLGANVAGTEFDFGELTEGLSKRRFLASS